MQGASFSYDMLILPIGGCGIVLGIQWFITLGDIMWNFKKIKMEFNFKGQKVSLKVIQPPVVKLIASCRKDKLLDKLAELCMISMGLLVQEEQSVEG